MRECPEEIRRLVEFGAKEGKKRLIVGTEAKMPKIAGVSML